jgi:hypothetical protein
MTRRILLFGLLGLLAAFFVFGAMVNAAPPAQQNEATTPKATRDPIRQATRRATRGLEALITPEATAAPETGTDAGTDADAEAEAGAISPVAPGAMTSEIVIFNPDTSGTATVRVEIYNASGVVAYSKTVTVSANGAQLVTLPASLSTNFQGGAQISSDKNVQALVVGSNANKTARDSYEGTMAPALDVTLPFVRHLAASTQNTLLAIQNTTDSAASVAVTFHNLDGSTANSQNLNIAAHRSAYLNTDALFPSGTFVGSARMVSDQNIAVAAQSLYYKDTAAFSGTRASDGDTTLFLNHAERKLNGGGTPLNWSEIFVRNNGSNATDITLDFYSAAGALVTSSTAPSVAPDGTAQYILKDALFDALGASYSGWIKIRSSGEPLTATSLQALDKGKRLYSVNALANSAMGTRYVCGDTSRMATQNSRISILNADGAATAKVIVRLYNQTTGAKIVQTKVSIPPNSAGLVLLSDTKFAAAGTNYQGMTLVQAKGAAPPKLVVTVDNPFGSAKPSGTTGYACSKL